MSATAPELHLYLVTTSTWSKATTVWAPTPGEAGLWSGLGPDVVVRLCPVDDDATITQPPLPF